jgi:hypothetical protein
MILTFDSGNREARKCINGTRRSEEQIQATILARLPKRRHDSVMDRLDQKHLTTRTSVVR